MADADFKPLLKRLIRRDTKAFQRTLDGNPEAVSKLSDRAKVIHAEIVKRDFGVPKENLTQLVSAFLGEQLPPVKQAANWIFTDCGCIVVKVLKKPARCGEEFKAGSFFARLPGQKYDGRNLHNEAMTSQTGGGTNQAFFAREEFEFATDEEIDKFVDNLPEAVVAVAKKTVVILTEEDK